MSVRYTVAPVPAQFEMLQEMCDALPQRAEAVDDCCGTLRKTATLPTRTAAQEWLVFLQALGLAEEIDSGFQRNDVPLRRESASDEFVNSIYGVEELLGVFEGTDRPLSVSAVCAELPSKARNRKPGVASQLSWETYIERLLEWSVVFGLVTVTGEGYRL